MYSVRVMRIFRCLCVVMVLSLLTAQSVVRAQSDLTEARRAVVQSLYDELYNAGNFSAIDTILAPDYVNRGYGNAELTRDDFTAALDAVRAALPDLKADVEVLLVDGAWAASRVRFSGTFSKEWLLYGNTYKATNKHLEWTANVLHHFADDLIVEDFVSFDRLGLFRQMGASPLPALITALLQSGKADPIVIDSIGSSGQEDIHREAFSHVINDALNNGDLSAIDTYMAVDYRTHEPFGNFTREQFKGVVQTLRTIIPDLKVDIDAMVAEGDWLAARLIYTGTFSKPIKVGRAEFQPTNKPIQLIINVFVHFNADGIGFEDYKEYNRLNWLVQAGVIEG
ncbi:MAG: ester cyclase [Anaerolineae bacterium]|nr:ester cyclase [Anaerolineae bacterium]